MFGSGKKPNPVKNGVSGGAEENKPQSISEPVTQATASTAKVDGNNTDLDPEMVKKFSAVRTKLHETFGKVALAMMAMPRYRNLSISDLGSLILDPLMRDRIAMAMSTKEGETEEGALTGIAIWASVSEDVDKKIREQIKAGVFPVRLQADDWKSGGITWLLDVVAPNQRLTTAVIANFRQVVDGGDMRIHPIVTRLVDPEVLKKMGAKPMNKSSD